jgi:glycine betaine/choline ABC-type transport system substrate-binding protein
VSKKKNPISLIEKLHSGDPVAIQEEQKLMQTVQELITPDDQYYILHNKQTPNTDKLVVKNSVATSKPAKTELEVFYKYITIFLYHISF